MDDVVARGPKQPPGLALALVSGLLLPEMEPRDTWRRRPRDEDAGLDREGIAPSRKSPIRGIPCLQSVVASDHVDAVVRGCLNLLSPETIAVLSAPRCAAPIRHRTGHDAGGCRFDRRTSSSSRPAGPPPGLTQTVRYRSRRPAARASTAWLVCGAGGSVAAGRGRGLPDRRARAAIS